MKTRRHIFGGLMLAAAALVCLTGCKKDDEGEKVVLGADFEQTAGTQKTYVGNSDKTIYWNTDDEVLVNGVAYPVHEGAVEVKLNEDGYAAVYPATEGNSVDKNGGTVVIPATQNYVKDANGVQQLNGPMAARLDSKTGRLMFRNLYAVIKVTVQAKSDAPFTLNSITVESTKDLAGTQDFSFNGATNTNTGTPTCNLTEGSGSTCVTLTGIGKDIPAGGKDSFYLYTVPFTETAGVTIRVNGVMTDKETKTRNVAIPRSRLGFTTVNVTELTNISGYVDLGLSVLWATCNVGAANPWDNGDYFAWGETKPYYKSLTWTSATYTVNWNEGKSGGYCWQSYCGNDNFQEWNPKPYGTDNKLLPAYDAATANWGGNWRMPTKSESDELKNDCNWEWSENYNGSGVKGYKVTSKKEGYKDKFIFLPAAGYFDGTTLNNIGSAVRCASSALNDSENYYRIYATYGSVHGVNGISRRIGSTVRPVMPKN